VIDMDFSDALRALKVGNKVARAGWNGKGMWLTLSPGKRCYPNDLWADNNRKFADRQPSQMVQVLPYITLKTADNCIVPWLASQTDILADDWELVE
jgi:hypothetical protein